MAGPDHRDGEVTTTDSTPVESDTGSAATRRPVPRKSAPIKQFRRKKSAPTPAPSRPEAEGAQDDSIAAPATAEPVSVPRRPSDSSTESAPERSGAALSYRERRRAAGTGSGDTAGRVVTKRAHRSGLGLALAGGVAGLVVIALVVVSVLFVSATDRIDDRAADRAEYSAFARQMIVNLTSLSPTTVDQFTNTLETKTSGKALEQLQQSMQQTVDNIKSAGVTTTGTILSDAVTSSDADSATVILVSGWTMNAPPQAAAGGATADPADQGPIVQTFRWRVGITKINGEMKMDSFQWVT